MNYFNSHVWSSQQTCRKREKEGNANSLWRPLTLKTRQASPSLGLWDPGQWSVPQHHWKPFREGCQLPAGIKNICGGLPEDGQLISSLTCSKCFLWLKPALQSLLHGIHDLDPYGYSFPVSCFVTVLLVCTEKENKNNCFTNHYCAFTRAEFMPSSSPLRRFLDKVAKCFPLYSAPWEVTSTYCIRPYPILCESAH